MPCDALSVVVPVYNNAATLAELRQQVTDQVRDHVQSLQFVFIDDASTDGSAGVLADLKGPSVTVLSNDKNMGQQSSIHRALAVARGDVVVVMDADLQDPPVAIPDLLSALEAQSADAVFARRVGQYQSKARMLTSVTYRWVLRRLTNLPRGAGGFVVMRGAVAQSLAARPTGRFYLVGMLGCGGYRLGVLPVKRNRRMVGKSGYSMCKRLGVALSNFIVIFEERMRRGRT